MPIRVLCMISSMRGGGSEQQMLMLLRHLDRSQFEPSLYLTDRVGDLLSRVPSDVEIHSFDEVPTGGLYFPGRILRQQRQHVKELLKRESIDVIFDRTFHMSMISCVPAKQLQIPRVSMIVSPPEQALPLVESRFVGLKKRQLSQAYQDSFRVLAVSRQAARSAESYYQLFDGSVNVIPNPVDLEAVCQAAQTTDPPQKDGLTLVCVGRMTSEKGQRDLITALEILQTQWTNDQRLNLWLIGDGPLRSQLEAQASVLSNQTNVSVEFLGAHQNPMPFIASADALVLPSIFEGMPNVVLEAMALGTPVIATRAGGTVELERDEPTILWAEVNDPKSIANAIVELSADSVATAARTAAATRMIQQHHNVAETTKKIERLLTEACGKQT